MSCFFLSLKKITRNYPIIILLQDNFFTIHNIQTLSGLSDTLTSEVEVFISFIFHLVSYLVHASNVTIKTDEIVSTNRDNQISLTRRNNNTILHLNEANSPTFLPKA